MVANPEQARSPLTAVSYVGGYGRARGRRLVGLFACMYYGALCSVEAVGLTAADLRMPEAGWGTALLNRTRPSVGKQWTDSRETHGDRGLKNRPAEGEWSALPRTTACGRRPERWRPRRPRPPRRLLPGHTTSGTRHCRGGSTPGWTRQRSPNVRATGIEVLLSRYAKCKEGRQEIANRKIDELLREYE